MASIEQVENHHSELLATTLSLHGRYEQQAQQQAQQPDMSAELPDPIEMGQF
jgi:hypothetical protein